MAPVDKFDSQKHREYKRARQNEKETTWNKNVKYYDIESDEDLSLEDDLDNDFLPYYEDEDIEE